MADNISIVSYRSGLLNETVVLLDPPLPLGWIDIQLHLGADIQVFLPALPDPVISLTNDLAVDKIKVFGRNVTVDCNENMMVWSVNSVRQTIPVAGLGTHTLTIYSRMPVRPAILLGQKKYSFGLDGNKIGPGKDLSPLLPYTNYNLTFVCTATSVEEMNCSLTTGEPFASDPVQCVQTECLIHVEGKDANTFFVMMEREGISHDYSGNLKIHLGITITSFVLSIGSIILLVMLCYKFRKSIRADIEEGMLLSQNKSLWDAVKDDDIRCVKYLLSKGAKPNDKEKGKFTTAFLEAHIRGRNEIVEIFSRTGGNSYPPFTEIVDEVRENLEIQVKEIFSAVRLGEYHAVHKKLKRYDLPGTVRDLRGWAIPHYIANERDFGVGGPLWDADDIRSFLSNEQSYLNAIDHRGQTALHILAKHARGKETTKTVWGGRECTVSEAWVGVAKLLVERGCDPRIRDHNSRSAWDIAENSDNWELKEFLRKECSERGELDRKAAMVKFPGLLEATRRGDTDQMKQLLTSQVPAFLRHVQVNPLDLAVRHKHRDALFLLLSAGVVCDPLCPNIEGQPALFSALITKVRLL
ncbi:uncharacterized protein LOC122243867 isoform X2 [Penaeus japonicus]|nr:uncharacterized protein LOC122243867 isoform X2 [Penaeus japonicus]